MIKPALLSAALCCAAIACITGIAKADDTDRLVDLKGTKIVVLHDTLSADGRYAVCWTLKRRKDKAAPVDWSQWDGDGVEFLALYNMAPPADNDGDYHIDYFAVDLRTGSLAPLDIDLSSLHDQGGAVWSGEVGGKRYGIFQVDYISMWDVLLVRSDGKKMDVVESAPMIPVEALLPRESRESYSIRLSVFDNDTGKPLPVFHGGYADVNYMAMIPHDADTGFFEGKITLRLDDGSIAKMTDGKREIDPDYDSLLNESAELRAADGELNHVYQALEKKLAPAARGALQREQTAWIKSRDSAAKDAGRKASRDPDTWTVRIRVLLEATRKRTAELKARLAPQH